MKKIIDEEFLEMMKIKDIKINDLMNKFNCSKTTITNHLYKLSINVPKGFYKTEGAVPGKPRGTPMSESTKEFFRKKFSGTGNPFYGKKHSNSTKLRMKENHADFKGDRNPFKKSLDADESKRDEHKQRCIDIWRERDDNWRNDFKSKISKGLAESPNLKDKSRHKKHKSGHYQSTKCNKEMFYRSSWELRMCKALETDKNVIKYSLEEFCVPYTLDGIERHTRIDFIINFVDGTAKMIEVKPKQLQSYGNNIIKINALKNYCENSGITFEVFALEEIENYEKLVGIN
jgi:hypothetical protein